MLPVGMNSLKKSNSKLKAVSGKICTGHHLSSDSTGHGREERSVPGLAAGVSPLTVCTVTGVSPRPVFPAPCVPHI